MDEQKYDPDDLKQHEAKEMAAIEEVKELIKHEHVAHTTERYNMDTPTIENVFKTGSGMPYGDGLGLGGGGLGLVALLALLGRGNLGLGNGEGGDAVNQITLGQIQQVLGDIKASVPLAEGQAQLALAAAQADINNHVANASTANLQGQGQLALGIANAISTAKDLASAQTQTLSAQINHVDNLVDRNLYQLSQVVTNDGEKTRSLIQSIDKQNDSRLITAQANEIVELRQEQRRQADRHGIEITMTNNQNQNQLQFQAQQQVLGHLANGLLDAVQNIRATNQAINIGSGHQHANPTNTNTNVRT